MFDNVMNRVNLAAAGRFSEASAINNLVSGAFILAWECERGLEFTAC